MFNFLVSALKDEVDHLYGKYKRVNPVILDVSQEKDRLDELVKGHDLVVRSEANVCIEVIF